MLNIRAYALALQQTGQLARAAALHRRHVAPQSRRVAPVDDRIGLLLALRYWQACLEEIGDRRSASETAVLADSVATGMRPRGQ